MAISRVQAGSYALNAQAWAQQKRRSMSLTTLMREIQSGSGLSCFAILTQLFDYSCHSERSEESLDKWRSTNDQAICFAST